MLTENNVLELDEIESIEYIGEMDTIDIEVEDTHMFFANDIYTHNSGFKNTLNDEESIGKAIEPFQVADVVIAYSQPPEMRASMMCYANNLKNRLGQKGIVLEVYYDPNKCIFQEVQVVNDLVLLSTAAKEKINRTAQDVIKKLRDGKYDKKTETKSN